MARPRIADRESIRKERINLALPLSVYSGIKSLADIRGTSTNDLLNGIACELVKKNSAVIAAFEAARQKAANDSDLNLDFGTES